MGKRTAALLLVMALCLPALAACHSPEPGPTETTLATSAPEVPAAGTTTETMAPATTVPRETAHTEVTSGTTAAATTPASVEDDRLMDFDQRVSVLGATSQEEFCANYEEALALYRDGLRPEGTMPVFDPAQEREDPGDFYYASLDPDTYGVSKFFVLPAGERSLTAEEYLELVAAAGQMTAQDLVLPENSWFSTQTTRIENDIPNSNRRLYPSERFWLPYLLGMYYQGQEVPTEGTTVSAWYLPLPGENRVYTVYPTGHLTPRGVLADGLHSLSLLPPERQASFIPPADTDFEAIKSAAIQIIRDHMGMTKDPIAVYCACPDAEGSGFDAPAFTWAVGLLYPRGVSYVVELKPEDLSLAGILTLSDGELVLGRDWNSLDARS